MTGMGETVIRDLNTDLLPPHPHPPRPPHPPPLHPLHPPLHRLLHPHPLTLLGSLINPDLIET